MKTVSVSLAFANNGYIAKPYWPEINSLIDIGKDVNPRLGDAKKAQAIAAACEKRGITPGQYEALLVKSQQPFYTIDGERDSEIVIPARVIHSFINNTSQLAPKAVAKVESKGLTFIGILVDHGFLTTGKFEKDAQKFERFVKMEDSNQRKWASDFHIDNFTASGILQVDEDVITVANLRKLFEYGGKWYGIGSARPQGFGRFTVTKWDVLTQGMQEQGTQEEEAHEEALVEVGVAA
jgi:hypothetical protein